MSKSITFTFKNKADYDTFMADLMASPLVRADRIRQEGESDEDLLKRVTFDWWDDLAVQGKAKQAVNGWKEDYQKMERS